MHARGRRRFVSIDAARQAEILREIDQNAEAGRSFLILVPLSCVIATFGLIQNSAAVIIGAMLIAPLMGPINAFALALVYGDPRRVVRALGTLLIGAAVAVALSTALGRLVTVVGTVDFVTEGLPSEILSRTQPSLFDLAVALAGGAAGSYALVQPRLSSALAGVAIATALMPPLCVVGIGVSQGSMIIWGGALLLFLTNFVAIVFAGSGIFALAGFLPAAASRRRWYQPGARLVNLVLLLPVVVLLTAFTINITQEAQTTAAIRNILTRELHPYRNTSLVGVQRTSNGDTLDIVATIRAPANLKLAAVIRFEEALAARLRRRVALKLLVVPVTALDPLNPPTFTLTPMPSRTSTSSRTPTPDHTAIPSRTFTVVSRASSTTPPRPTLRHTVPATRTLPPGSTATPSPRPTRTALRTATSRPRATTASTSTPTLRPSATATRTPQPSTTRTRTPRPTPTRTPLPTATAIAHAVVGGTGGQGVYARRAPGLTPIVTALPDGALVQLTGVQVSRDGYRWVQVVLRDGRVVWIAGDYLVPYHAYTQPRR